MNKQAFRRLRSDVERALERERSIKAMRERYFSSLAASLLDERR